MGEPDLLKVIPVRPNSSSDGMFPRPSFNTEIDRVFGIAPIRTFRPDAAMLVAAVAGIARDSGRGDWHGSASEWLMPTLRD